MSISLCPVFFELKKASPLLFLSAALILIGFFLRNNTSTISRKKVPNFLIFSIENLYYENNLNEDSLYAGFSEFARQNNIKIISPADNKLPFEWLNKIDSWPVSTWKNSKLRQIGLGTDLVTFKRGNTFTNYQFFIEVLNEAMAATYVMDIIKRRITEKHADPFFLLVNINYMLPPLYDIGHENLYSNSLPKEHRQLLNSFVFDPENFKDKAFIFSVLFDDYRFSRLTSFQSAMISTDIVTRDSTFWRKAYTEFVQDDENSRDLKLINELYIIKKKETARILLEIISELKRNDSLKDTIVILASGIHSAAPKHKIFNRLFTQDIQQNRRVLIMGRDENISKFKLPADGNYNLDEVLLKYIEDFK
ncbi:MAG: hypothetical protein WC635_03860 [Bacteriovorax sp.]|jgi:hypothetical protein